MKPIPEFSAETILSEILEWVGVESPTYAPDTVKRMQALAAARIARLGFKVERTPGSAGFADVIVGRRPGEGPPLLIIAHLDTVHPMGTLAGPLPVRREGDRCYGPGIYDMKAGTVMMITALEALIRADALNMPVTILINGDEEVGSPTSRALIEAEARKHAFVLIPEPANGKAGEVTTGRHAFQRFTITAHGRPAHSGWTNKEGRSAIRILAQVVEELESRSDFDKGPTYAVSVFNGGQWVNCVPMICTAQALCVARDLAKFDEIGEVMASLAGIRADVRIEVEKGPVRPLWAAQKGTLALYERARGIAEELGFELPHGQHGGGSDGNFTGALGIATLDGLGAMGHGAHTHEEHILVSSLVPRTKLLARLVQQLGRNP